jgi:hypothetical protein
MDIPIIIESILRHTTVIVILLLGGMVFRHLSAGQRITYLRYIIVAIFGIWASIRVINGMYSIPVYSIGNFFFFLIYIWYVDYELGKYTYKSFFRVLALLLLCCIPLHWIVVGDLNQQSEITSLIHIFLSIFILYSILNRPTKFADQLLRWAILFYFLGDLIFSAFVNEISWRISIELSKKLNLLHYIVVYIHDVFIIISFLFAYFNSKKTSNSNTEINIYTKKKINT